MQESVNALQSASSHLPMRQFVLLVIAFVNIAGSIADAQSTDPGDLFFVSAYMAVQAGEKAEQAGNFEEATSKFRYAAQVSIRFRSGIRRGSRRSSTMEEADG